MEQATLGGGCFWCLEAVFLDMIGVTKVQSGYAGGHLANPSYEEVCGKKTGHAEVVQVTFDPAKVSYRQLVEYFFRMHNPTQVNRQGPDVGDQYRSVIFAHSPEQRKVAEEVKTALDAARRFPAPIATKIEGEQVFWKAEDYHQKYYERNGKKPYCHLIPFAEEK